MVNNYSEILSNLDKIQSSVFKNYLFNLKDDYSVVDFDKYNSFINTEDKKISRVKYFGNIQALKIERWVYDKKEEIIDRFRNIYASFSNEENSLALVIKRTVDGTEFYFIVRSDGAKKGDEISTRSSICSLSNAIRGNFPGTRVKYESMINENKIEEDFFGIGDKKNNAISVLTNVSSEKSEKHMSQGIEKLLNGIVPTKKGEEYTVVFLAEPINHKEVLEIKNGYEQLASSIYSYSEYQTNEGITNATTTGESKSTSFTKGTNESISKTHGYNMGLNLGGNRATTSGESVGSGWLSGIVYPIKAITNSISSSMGSNIGGSFGYQYSRTKTEGTSESDTRTVGTNYCLTTGDMKSVTNNFKSYPIYSIINRIEKQLERIEQCEAVGMWRNATYVVSESTLVSKSVANYLLGLTQGEESFIEKAVVNSWQYRDEDFFNIKKFIQHFSHPVFINKSDILETTYKNNISMYDIECVTPTTYTSSMELAQVMTFPYKSIQGLASVECAEFERNVLFKDVVNSHVNEERQLELGSISYMHEVYKESKVNLNIESLTKHTFVTGSTGTGKSTAIYKMLHELREKDVPFLVIEPAKGEYRQEFKDYATVYSTNVNIGTLLQINPFRFDYEGILVHEHIDRLIEIFNVCWPMYAAMPAVLKDAVERAYMAAGWDLNLSINRVDENIFPTFLDVLKQLYKVIEESDFSQEVKSNYIGSLVTRVKSLTNGIFGQIFSSKDIGNDKLFNDYTIIDLSRVGSIETKAMIMGILVMRMQEYHMTFSETTNKLKHVTVLEEAHNLLKRTSTEQSSESSNLLGKSVEMIANAIAEMRTYGEGFIIADQSPGLMDMSVIRNTNTKLILGLPDFSDRELIGKSVGLNDEQIIEVAKLGQGISVVYQNEWIAPVLCAINKYEKVECCESNKLINKTDLKEIINKKKAIKYKLTEAILASDLEQVDKLKDEILEYSMYANIKVDIMDMLYKDKPLERDVKIKLIYDLLCNENIKKIFSELESYLRFNETIPNDIIKNSLYNKLIGALELPNNINDIDIIGILNILLYYMKVETQNEVERCEKFLNSIYFKIN